MEFDPIPDADEIIATAIVDAAVAVHKALGPGLLESVYEVCLRHELIKRGFTVERQVSIPIRYDNVVFEEGLRIDLLVQDSVICEIKAVSEMHPIFQAQLLTYLKLTNRRLGFLINFNVPVIKDGIKRMVR